MAVHSGKFGAINGEASIRDWSFNDTSVLPANVVSGSRFGHVRNPGIRSWSGNYNQLLAEPSILPGESGSGQFFTAPTSDVDGSTGITYAGSFVVTQAVITWDWTSGAHLSSALSFVGDGVLSSSSSVVTDVSVPAPLEVCGTKIEYSVNGTDYTELANVTSASLTLSCAAQAYVNSSTGCWTGQKAGPLDWAAAITVQDNIRTGPAIGSNYYWKFWVDDSTFWLLKWGIVKDYSNINVNIETGAIITQTINLEMNGAVGGVLGVVSSPSEVEWFNPTS
jgi:hypothetical protein